MKNRWAQGIEPRNFAWVLKGQLAICERPGGYSRTHRKVRRQEEIVWMRQERFSRVISTLPTEHNLHAYEELGLPFSHFAVDKDLDAAITLPLLYNSLNKWIHDGEKIVLHREEVGSELLGILAGFLSYTKRMPSVAQSISVIEHMFSQPISTRGRVFVLPAED